MADFPDELSPRARHRRAGPLAKVSRRGTPARRHAALRILWQRGALEDLREVNRFDTECRGDVMDLFGFFRKPIPCRDPEWNGLAFDIDDPRIPEAIRIAALSMYEPGMAMYFLATTQGGEWWLMDGENIVEASWLE